MSALRWRSGYSSTKLVLSSSPHYYFFSSYRSARYLSSISSETGAKAFDQFLQLVQSEKRREKLWLNYFPLPFSIPPNEYTTLLQNASTQLNFENLHFLLSKTHHSSQAAAVLGVQNLAQYYAPFFCDKDNTIVSKSLALHFSHWLWLMDKSARPKQILIFFDTIFHRAFRANLNSLLTLYEHILTEVVQLDVCDTVELEEIGSNLTTTFILSTIQYLSDLSQFAIASKLLTNAISEGLFPSHRVDHHLYGSLVIRAVPRNLDLTTTKKGWKKGTGRSQHNPMLVPIVETNPLLDSLFSVHGVGSTHADVILRDTFFKSLLVSGRPEVVILYDKFRQQANLKLSVRTHNRILEAHTYLLDENGMMASLQIWLNECRPMSVPRYYNLSYPPPPPLEGQTRPLQIIPKKLSTSLHSHRMKSITVMSPPDGRTYSLFINFFSSHPHLVTRTILQDLFENIQIDKLLPHQLEILKLFQLTKYLKSPVLANEMLRWFCGMSEDRPNEMSMEKTSAENISVQISKPVLNEIYSIVLDTNFNSMRFRDECLTIMLEMWRRDIQVDNDVMAKVMEGLKSSRNYSLVLELFSKMPLLGVKRDNRHVSLAVTALVRTKKISKALALIRKFETAELKLTKSAYIALAFRILKAIRLYPHDEILTVQNDKNQEVELSLEETIDVCLDLFYSGLHDSELYQGWSTVIFDLTIQTMSDPIYYLIDQRIRERLCNLDSLRSSSSSSSSSGSGHSPDHSHEQSDSDSLFSTEQRNQRIDSEPDDLDPPSPTPRPPPSPTSQEELSKYEKEYKWFHHFCSKLQEIRNEKGRPASLKWRRMKSNPLVNELSTINYLKSIEENSL